MKICSDNIDLQQFPTNFKNNQYILPHLARYLKDANSLTWKKAYPAKITSGICSIKKINQDWGGLYEHDCDLDKRSSGAPLLKITPNNMCVYGIQKGQSLQGKKVNYASPVFTPGFQSKLKQFVIQNCQ